VIAALGHQGLGFLAVSMEALTWISTKLERIEAAQLRA
jgi:hypothetical protein